MDFKWEPDTKSINVKCISNFKQKEESDSNIKSMKVNSDSTKKTSNSNSNSNNILVPLQFNSSSINSVSLPISVKVTNKDNSMTDKGNQSEEELDFCSTPINQSNSTNSNSNPKNFNSKNFSVPVSRIIQQNNKISGIRNIKKDKIKQIIRQFQNNPLSHIKNILKQRDLSICHKTLTNYIDEVEEEDRAENMHKSASTLIQPGPLCEVASGVDHKSQCETPVVIEKFSKSNKPTHESDSLMDGVENENDLLEMNLNKKLESNLENSANLKNSANLENLPNLTNLKTLFDLNSSLKNMLHNSMNDEYYPHNRIVYDNVIYQYIEVKPDGNCFFHSLFILLTLSNNFTFSSANDIRDKVMDYMVLHINDYFENIHNQEPTNYIINMCKQGTYADELTWRAASKLLNVKLVIIRDVSYDKYTYNETATTCYHLRLTGPIETGHFNPLFIENQQFVPIELLNTKIDKKSKKIEIKPLRSQLVKANSVLSHFVNRHNKVKSTHQIALGEILNIPKCVELINTICPFCHAIKIKGEPMSYCCNKNLKIPLQHEPPVELLKYLDPKNPLHKHFISNIRLYNNALQMASSCIQVDRITGIHSLKIKGKVYQQLGSVKSEEGSKPKFMQLYIMENDKETENRLNVFPNKLDTDILIDLQTMMHRENRFVKFFKYISDFSDPTNVAVLYNTHLAMENRNMYNLPTSSGEVCGILPSYLKNSNSSIYKVVDKSNHPTIVNALNPASLPLHFVLLFPRGEFSWPFVGEHVNTDFNAQSILNEKPLKSPTAMAFFKYVLMERYTTQFQIHKFGKLFQEYCITLYTNMEWQNLSWVLQNQKKLRCENRQGLVDAVAENIHSTSEVGKQIILPSNFTLSPRFMNEKYMDNISMVLQIGAPCLFITMTCNPKWKEITDRLDGALSVDRPDIIVRVFSKKMTEYLDDIYYNQIYGRCIAYTYCVETQKRGLPHMHLLIVLHPDDKFDTPEKIDSVVSAEMPSITDPAYEHVLKHMIHGQCGSKNPDAPCMETKKGKRVCRHHFPQPLSENTLMNDDKVTLRRRNLNNVTIKDRTITDTDVAAYNKWALIKYDCHINVMICPSIKCIKYITKYMHKPHTMSNINLNKLNEVDTWVDGREISSTQAVWQGLGIPLFGNMPAITRLPLHLENDELVRFEEDDILEDVLAEKPKQTMLVAYFERCLIDEFAKTLKYIEFPVYYVWNSKEHKWNPRKQYDMVGRMYVTSPKQGELYYLQIILNTKVGITSFTDARTYQNIEYATFYETCRAMGILDNDQYVFDTMDEACLKFVSGNRIRKLFIVFLMTGQIKDPQTLWGKYKEQMSEDYKHFGERNPIKKLYMELNKLLELNLKSLEDFGIEKLDDAVYVKQEIEIKESDIIVRETLMTDEQRIFYKSCLESFATKTNKMKMVEAYAGTGKTFVFETLIMMCKFMKIKYVVVAPTGIAACLLTDGYTSHSTFSIPLDCDDTTSCSWKGKMLKKMEEVQVIFWDEVCNSDRHILETVDRTFRDLQTKRGVDSSEPFGGRFMFMGGNWSQILPVIEKASRAMIIDSILSKSYMWENIQKFKLTENMRLKDEPVLSQFLIDVAYDKPNIYNEQGYVEMPTIVNKTNSLNEMIDLIHFDSNNDNKKNSILTPLNETVDQINDLCIKKFEGDFETFYSSDRPLNETGYQFPIEYLNKLTTGSIPNHIVQYKIGAPVLLIRNLIPSQRLMNGSRLIIHEIHKNLITCENLLCTSEEDRFIDIPRIVFDTDKSKAHMNLRRIQFPLRLCFAMTCNKSQGQTLNTTGIYLGTELFAHGQLYVTLSRVTSFKNLHYCLHKDIKGINNVVWPEVYDLAQ